MPFSHSSELVAARQRLSSHINYPRQIANDFLRPSENIFSPSFRHRLSSILPYGVFAGTINPSIKTTFENKHVIKHYRPNSIKCATPLLSSASTMKFQWMRTKKKGKGQALVMWCLEKWYIRIRTEYVCELPLPLPLPPQTENYKRYWSNLKSKCESAVDEDEGGDGATLWNGGKAALKQSFTFYADYSADDR